MRKAGGDIPGERDLCSVPAFFPDATRGVVRTVDAADLLTAGIEGVVVNAYHLMTSPGLSVIESLGGVRRLMGWDGLVVSDSGGFQLLSLIHRNKSAGRVDSDGVTFYKKQGSVRKAHIFTPEKSIQVQFGIGADIMFCLDDCPSPRAGEKEQDLCVERTISWADRCKREHARLSVERERSGLARSRLFAVIQGEDRKELREKCAAELRSMGFDGYAFGGWPMDREGRLKREIIGFTASLMPDGSPKFALGVGNPREIVECAAMGYTMFDCVLPTRDARRGRIYVLDPDFASGGSAAEGSIYDSFYVTEERYARDREPIDRSCDCRACRAHSRAYMHHLFAVGDELAHRLATIHNLRTYSRLVGVLRERAGKA